MFKLHLVVRGNPDVPRWAAVMRGQILSLSNLMRRHLQHILVKVYRVYTATEMLGSISKNDCRAEETGKDKLNRATNVEGRRNSH